MALKTFYLTDTTNYCTIFSGLTYCTVTAGGMTSRAGSENSGDLVGVSITANSQTTGQYWMKVPTGVANWASGNYTCTVNVTSSNMNLTLDEIHICRRQNNSNCTGVIASIGSLTGIGRSLSSTGSADHVVSGSASNYGGGDDLLLVCLQVSNGAMTTQAATIEVTVATPIDDGGGGGFVAKSRRTMAFAGSRIGSRRAA